MFVKAAVKHAQITLRQPRKAIPYFLLKRLADIIVSFLLFILLLPIFLLICVWIKLDSTGHVFYLQERVGRDGAVFQIIKFRTMIMNAEVNGPQWAERNDQRMTKLGTFLRKYRIDEIPQLLNVIRGDMSIVGPRPERQVFVQKFEEEVPGFCNRLAVKPGITGWAQVHGGYDLTPLEKLEMDIYYINHCSVFIDLIILLKSIPVIVFARGWR